MTTISEEEFHDNLDELLRRVEAGEEFTITRSGRPAVRLCPPASHLAATHTFRREKTTPPSETDAY